MNMFWIIYGGLLVFVLLINTFSTISSTNLNQSDTNNENLTITNNCSEETNITKIFIVCEMIKMNISNNSQVFYANSLTYYEDINHYSRSAITLSVCTVEPGTDVDVAKIMKIIGENRVPFSIKSGGHNLNPGFSSTKGVHISLRRFRQVIYHENNKTVDVGPGLTWVDVYKALEPYNISVLGGRVPSVGVGGLALGGGYGWKSNQYGLTIDNILEYKVITPDGNIVYINNQSNSDIFFGLKGGLNNFGIVINFNMRALIQTDVYGGNIFYGPFQFNNALNAMIKFQTINRDPKAQILASITSFKGIPTMNVTLFYDAPTAPDSVFKDFKNIFYIGTLKSRSYVSFVEDSPIFLGQYMRARFHSVSVLNLSIPVINTIKHLSISYSLQLVTMADTFVTFVIEPFLFSYFDNSTDGAYPHSSNNPVFPILIHFGWQLITSDQYLINKMEIAANTILQSAIEDGQDVGNSKQILYPNYALETTPLEMMYGDNVDRLKTIRQLWDPNNVMCLAGGFRF